VYKKKQMRVLLENAHTILKKGMRIEDGVVFVGSLSSSHFTLMHQSLHTLANDLFLSLSLSLLIFDIKVFNGDYSGHAVSLTLLS
jgi:hypothetical protein